MIQSHWRGWPIVLFEDRGSPYTAEGNRELAEHLGIQLRFLLRATLKLNAMDYLWRHVKGRALADHKTRFSEESAQKACQYIFDLSLCERLKKAGILSGDFWLTK
jgi:hypothetical protein